MSLRILTELSRRYGADPAFTLAGGGNTSWKEDGGRFLHVKPSGVALAEIHEEDFVKMDRNILRECFALGDDSVSFSSVREREERVKKLMAYAVLSSGEEGRRPSVEAPLHEIMPFRYVVHLHPALVNAMTCGREGKRIASDLFPDALWVDYCDPGLTLACRVRKEMELYRTEHGGMDPAVIFLQNHGVFVGAEEVEGIDGIYAEMMDKLRHYCLERGFSLPLSKAEEADRETVLELAPLLRGWLLPSSGTRAPVVSATGAFPIPRGPLTPDHLVYAKAFGLVSDHPDGEEILRFREEHKYLPRMLEIPGKAVFCAGETLTAALTVRDLAENGALIEQLAPAFGGVHYLTDSQREFIENWEVESYRASVAAGSRSGKKSSRPMSGLVAVVTGGAQGFGFGIARYLAAEGADVAIADLNVSGALEAARKLGGGGCRGFSVNIADEESVKTLFEELVSVYGGVDLFVANAGVLKAGSVKNFELKDWKLVTDVNYNGYFLCVKHCSRLMARQNAVSGLWSDIVQVNSKSGLAGSRANGAYAGSKFGTIGLTQSFALELVADHIKVNSVCPGNFFDGPLWSDPEKGLFVQYLAAGKVPGAKTAGDVREYYEKLIPMRRGCLPEDVARAIAYAVCQNYETGQAIPVTGGQIMLN